MRRRITQYLAAPEPQRQWYRESGTSHRIVAHGFSVTLYSHGQVLRAVAKDTSVLLDIEETEEPQEQALSRLFLCVPIGGIVPDHWTRICRVEGTDVYVWEDIERRQYRPQLMPDAYRAEDLEEQKEALPWNESD